MTGSGLSLWVALGTALAAVLLASMVLILPWLRLRRIRLQIEGRYLEAVADFHAQKAPPTAARVIAQISGESARRLLRGMTVDRQPAGPACWPARGWLRYDQDQRERPVVADTFSIPGVWWAQIRRVRLRYLGWIDEMHEVEEGSVSSGYWWLGVWRIHHPAARSSELALRAQALGEAVLTPWVWFAGQGIEWEDLDDGRTRVGRIRPGGLGIRLQLDNLERPIHLELRDDAGGERVRVEYEGWNWSDTGLRPRRMRLIEAPGTVNAFTRLELQLGIVQWAPAAAGPPSR